MTEKELQEVYAQVIVMWKLIKKYSSCKQDEEFWHECIIEFSALEELGFVGEELGRAALNILERYSKRKYQEIQDIYSS